MNRELEKLVFALALSGLSERELHKALLEIDITGPRFIVDMIIETRRAAKLGLRDLHGFEVSNTAHHYSRKRHRDLTSLEKPRNDSEAIFMVDDLLRGDAGLNAMDAAAMLSASLSREGIPASDFLPFRPKTGFRTWLAHLFTKFPPSILLHHATMIRNSAVHMEQGDWPLRKREG